MQLAGRILADAEQGAQGDQRGEMAGRGGQRAEHAQFRASVAILGVERIADEAAIAGLRRLPAAEQADLALELAGGGGDQAECAAPRTPR